MVGLASEQEEERNKGQLKRKKGDGEDCNTSITDVTTLVYTKDL